MTEEVYVEEIYIEGVHVDQPIPYFENVPSRSTPILNRLKRVKPCESKVKVAQKF